VECGLYSHPSPNKMKPFRVAKSRAVLKFVNPVALEADKTSAGVQLTYADRRLDVKIDVKSNSLLHVSCDVVGSATVCSSTEQIIPMSAIVIRGGFTAVTCNSICAVKIRVAVDMDIHG